MIKVLVLSFLLSLSLSAKIIIISETSYVKDEVNEKGDIYVNINKDNVRIRKRISENMFNIEIKTLKEYSFEEYIELTCQNYKIINFNFNNGRHSRNNIVIDCFDK